MFSSAELIEALRRRMRRSLRPLPPPGEFPPAWREWFAAMASRPGRVSGASAEDMVAAMAAREPLVPPRALEDLGRWRAFATLWRQDWQPASSDERWTRIASMSGSLLLHLLFLLAIVWLMLVRFHFPAPEADARDGEEHVLQVEYIGEGTPADAGGGAAESPVDIPDPAEPSPTPAAGAGLAGAPQPEDRPEPVAEATQPLPEPLAETQPPPVPERELVIEVPTLAAPEVQVAAQALQVTEVEVADSRFEVPPPREVVVDVPEAPRAAEVSVRRRDIDVDAQAQVQAPSARAPREVEVSVPEAAPRGVSVAERRIELAETREVSAARTRDLSTIQTREPGASVPAVRERAVPMPAGAPAVERGQAPSSAASASPATGDGRVAAPASTPPGGRPDVAGSGARSADTAPGAGQLQGQPPGALPSTRGSDDWGDSTRSQPGRQAGTPGASGLFNADGRPRLADGGRVGGGLPPGAITEDFENIDRHGTWLKRPPYDYEPTAFDRFWMPSETLLEEWVRKSVTEVRIPIPGTTKSIRCVTVMLALGGACDIVDPNLQEQPAMARPPPDVPFKRELQEDQDSLGPPSGS
ncbi:hypothetical protein [Luteimonas arsenica]|uniref:hypothetical protein n=1 Tax=Luteimonas arsenica TaxID=1586242 RepID=UPI001055C3B4|nr:hypothetical protein [Luteimonas arsenica]